MKVTESNNLAIAGSITGLEFIKKLLQKSRLLAFYLSDTQLNCVRGRHLQKFELKRIFLQMALKVLLKNVIHNAVFNIHSKKKILLFFFCIFTINAFSLTLSEKIEITKRLSIMRSFLFNNEYVKAKDILLEIKRNHPLSEFNTISNYYLARIEFNQGNNFAAAYYSDLCIEDIDDARLNERYRNNILSLAGFVYYRLGLIDKAVIYLEKTLISDDPVIRNRAGLYLSLIYFDDKKTDLARYYYYNVTTNLLNKTETDIYYYLNNYIGWTNIDTSKIGFRDPNISCIYAENDILYIGLWHGGLIIYNYILDTHRFISSPALVSNEIRAIYASGNFVWIGTSDGISLLNKRDDTVSGLDIFKGYKITDIKGYKGNIIIGTLGRGLLKYNHASGELTSIISSESISAVYSNSDFIVASTFNSKLYKYDEKGLSEKRYSSISRKPITEISGNGEKFILSTYGDGIIIGNSSLNEFKIFNSSNTPIIKNDFFLTVSEKNNKFYCGSLGNGIYYFNGSEINEFKISDYFAGTDIQQIRFYNEYMFIATLGEGILVRIVK